MSRMALEITEVCPPVAVKVLPSVAQYRDCLQYLPAVRHQHAFSEYTILLAKLRASTLSSTHGLLYALIYPFSIRHDD